MRFRDLPKGEEASVKFLQERGLLQCERSCENGHIMILQNRIVQKINVEQPSAEIFLVEVKDSFTIGVLKWKIHEKVKVVPKQQRLFFEGIEMDDNEYKLSFYGIQRCYNINYRIKLAVLYTEPIQTYFLNEKHFDHKWTVDFRNINDAKVHYRGGKIYARPVGCVRYAVKVLGKYTDDKWIGMKGVQRTEKEPDGEWPVAYHGTKELNVLDILENGFLLQKGIRFAFGKGIYCTPDIQTALGYAHNYEFRGTKYKLILQCRVDPVTLQIVLKSDGATKRGEYWLLPDGQHIRPYAVCAFQQNS